MKKIILSLASGLVLCVSACTGNTPKAAQTDCAIHAEAADPALSAAIDTLVDSAVARGFAGGVAVMRDGVLVYSRTAGSASLSEDIPVTEETLFEVASVTKYFTAVLVMKAAEEGKFSLNDSIAVLAPDTRLAARGVTYFDLLSHQSGLGSTYVAEETTDGDAALAAIDKTEIDEEKVGGFRYSNDGYDLLGVLLERVYGQTYETLLQEKIFAKACLTHASHWSLVDLTNPHIVAQPLTPFPETLRPRNYGMLASAGLLISVADLARFEKALSNGSIINADSRQEMLAPRGDTRIGPATFGAFLTDAGLAGRRLRALGSEDWGDNAAMHHYLDKNVIVAVVTSRGPAEETGEPMFRNELTEAIEAVLFAAD
ncbi:serine hydrolase domain-containing protein [Marinicaulis aureus]|uniref:Serine hydrolase domain-containing protein n=1 Tax=Hyphococcus aureus TaxID=2666033 RepID=A0ABW1KW80_9PROT